MRKECDEDPKCHNESNQIYTWHFLLMGNLLQVCFVRKLISQKFSLFLFEPQPTPKP